MAVLNGIQSKSWTIFTTQNAYQLEDTMMCIFPNNKNIKPKIRQQLQILRDMGILIHVGRGEWMLPCDKNNEPGQAPTASHQR